MCRILGVSLANNDERLDIAEIAATLFPELVRQGPHAYGWMSFSEQTGEIIHEKFVGRCDTDDAWKKIMYGVDPKARWMVGHTRFATHGDPKDLRNDHPIPHGKIIGVHNGVLTNHEEILEITGREDPKTQVDSEAIFAAVNKWGPTKGLRRIHGNMVSVFANRTEPEVLRIARTSGRQLTLGFTKKGNLIFASDEFALHKLEPEIRFDHFTTISENRLLVVRDGKIINRYTFRKPPRKISAAARSYPVLLPPRPRVFVPPPAQIVIPSARQMQAEQQRVIEPRRLTHAEYEDILERREARAQRRGEMLFPATTPRQIVSSGKSAKGQARAARKRIAKQAAAIDHGELRYYEGQLLTEREYLEMLKSES